jgi:methionyl-tRNA synthetase
VEEIMPDNNRKFYITTPIYYVNDTPHIGHAYTTLLGDVLAGYHRLIGKHTFFLTGTDEHGQKIENAALERECSPEKHADEYVERFKRLWAKLSIKNDDFIRTIEPRHTKVVESVLTDLYEKGDIYKGIYTGWYCTPCERFFTEKDLVKGLCPECQREVERIEENNYFFAMSKYQNWLIQYIENNPAFIQPECRRNETLGFLQRALGDLCISRPKKRLSWGIELPFDNEYICYVWFDALINYISAIGYTIDNERFHSWWPVDYHLIGKDILTTHTVYWTTMLKAIGLQQPKTIFAHGWWLTEGGKISKSKGNAVDPLSLIDKYGVDAFRYYLIADMTAGQDASFSEERFISRYNSDLANNLGNLANRAIHLIYSLCNGIVPAPRTDEPLDQKLRDAVVEIAQGAEALVNGLKIDAVVSNAMKGCTIINRYLERTEPWKVKKDESTRGRLNSVLGNTMEALQIVSGVLYPIIPGKISELRTCIGCSDPERIPVYGSLVHWSNELAGKTVVVSEALFPRIY